MCNSMTFWGLLKESWVGLRGRWGIAILTMIIFFLIQNAVSFLFPIFISPVINWLIAPMQIGLAWFFLSLGRGEDAGVGMIFDPFQKYGKMLWGISRPGIFIFLWSLLLIIPGIIAIYRYFLTPYILHDYPELSVKEAMKKSCELMYGCKLRIFGYMIVMSLMAMVITMFTLCIGLIWLLPWYNSFCAKFYLAVLREKEGCCCTESAEIPESAEIAE